MSEPRRRANYAGRSEDDAVRINVRMTEEEESRLEAKAEIAGILPRAGSLSRRNMSEAIRQAIEAWQPVPYAPEQPAAQPTKKGTKRIFARG